MSRVSGLLVCLVFLAAACTGGGTTVVGDEESTATQPPTTLPAAAQSATTQPATTQPPTTPPPTTQPPTTIDPLVLEVASMTLEAKIGQLLMPVLRGTDPGAATDPDTPAGVVATFQLGGVIYLGPNIEDAAQVAAMSAGLQAAGGEGPGLLIGVDQEGGRVQRIADGVTPLPPARELAAQGPEAVLAANANLAQELSAQGINMVFAPVADLVAGNAGVIGDRSFSADPETAGVMVAAAVTGLESNNVAAVVKHWPGHGATTIDSHKSLPTLDVDLDLWRERERVPFAAGVDAGVSAVMVGHLALPGLDPSGQPATVSSVLIEDFLRADLGFDGVVMTDALDMGAVSSVDRAELAVQSIEAGIDILLVPPDLEAARRGLLDAIASGRLSEDRIDASVLRILQLKARLGLIS